MSEPGGKPRVLLVGPYDPSCGEYTFLSPPLGVWRLAGVLEAAGITVDVLDPNCCLSSPEEELAWALCAADGGYDVIGFSTTGMTLRYDLSLAHLARRMRPDALLVAGGMEATFNTESVMRLGPFDMCVLGEGERPLLQLCERLGAGSDWRGIPGTSFRGADGALQRLPQRALTREELRDSIFKIPYERMPYKAYWRKLERSYRVRDLPYKAERETRLGEIRAVRLITLNYCPMNCTFCSSTNFLHSAQGSTARMARLDAGECMAMLRRIVAAHPGVRTVIFQDDIFVFPTDARILPLCEAIVEAKRRGELPRELQFISTNRIDSMNPERLAAMRRAGFRVLGFGVENFSLGVLKEFGKARIHPLIEPVLESALQTGITPFLDMIMTSPRGSLQDLAENVSQAYRWTLRGCEVGMYPYVIPFSGAAMASDASLLTHTISMSRHVAGTEIVWDQPMKILPLDPVVRQAILEIEERFEERLAVLEQSVAHLPSRVRSLLWIVSSIPTLEERGLDMPDLDEAEAELLARLPGVLGSGSSLAASSRSHDPSTVRVPTIETELRSAARHAQGVAAEPVAV
jgi:radical SAM superfamily enzyme YgiQ (UPF0313 family)